MILLKKKYLLSRKKGNSKIKTANEEMNKMIEKVNQNYIRIQIKIQIPILSLMLMIMMKKKIFKINKNKIFI